MPNCVRFPAAAAAGKSTLLRLLMGREKPTVGGHVALGEHNIVPNYFEQNQAEALDGELSVLETLVQASPDAKLNDLKSLLGRMLFSSGAMDKKVGRVTRGAAAKGAMQRHEHGVLPPRHACVAGGGERERLLEQHCMGPWPLRPLALAVRA